MRFFKIFSIVITVIFFCVFMYFVYVIIENESKRGAPFLAYVYLALIFISILVTFVYHFKSYHYYRAKENMNLSKKLSKILWAGAISYNSLLLFVAGMSAYDLIIYRMGFMRWREVAVLSCFLFIGGIGILEVSLLKKRIKRLKSEVELKDEIESIGN
ncbi:hypothetical protein IMCC3317_21220 [Kordia antarctica]|uniref:DUF2975 domain-containing protein n=1 Tax=Kordia antarctica TaxID=1218801 RepID=A0A7L4ZJE4_9FLAO|nr:hypothetical protein [Kordia antarctica]QHI36752.1 hypothetical protein IMCC3317_21220 [Kordia antarctica]